MTNAAVPIKKARAPHHMAQYIFRRVLVFLPTMLIMSAVIFFIIQLPPGDYATTYVASLKAEGNVVDANTLAELQERFGLNQPWYVQYFKWMQNILTRFDFGYSFEQAKDVWSVVGPLLPMTVTVSLITMLFTYLVGIPLGIYSAVKQYSVGDYVLTTIGFPGHGSAQLSFCHSHHVRDLYVDGHGIYRPVHQGNADRAECGHHAVV